MPTCSQTSHHGAQHHLQWARAFGDRNKPPILLLHGIRMGWEIWRAHAELLADRYHVIAIDLPGHGALADLPLTEENVVATLSTAIERIGVIGSPSPPIGPASGPRKGAMRKKTKDLFSRMTSRATTRSCVRNARSLAMVIALGGRLSRAATIFPIEL